MKRFDVVIDYLVRLRFNNVKKDAQREAAIRFLRAGPAIREALLGFIEWGPMTSSDLNLHRAKFRALLDALPDGE
jgi:hypothetical protein